MRGFDTVYYGADLADYFQREFHLAPFPGVPLSRGVRHIPFWSDIVDQPDLAYAYYEAAAANVR